MRAVDRSGMTRRGALTGAAATVGLLAGMGAARAFPTQTVRLVVGYAPGGTVDQVSRVLADGLAREVAPHSVVVENRSGGGATIAALAVAQAPADGHTLLYSTLVQATMRAMHPRLPIDPVEAFRPVCYIGAVPICVAVNEAVPARDMQELTALLRANPGRYDYASAGVGSPPHLAAELYQNMAGVRINHVPYRGSGSSLQDLIAGNIAILFSTGFVAARQPNVRVLGVTSTRRAAVLPEVMTVEEAGFAGYEAYSWHMVFAPAATPRPAVMRLNEAVNRAIRRPEVLPRLADQEMAPVGGTPEDAARFFEAERERWERTLRQIGLAG